MFLTVKQSISQNRKKRALLPKQEGLQARHENSQVLMIREKALGGIMEAALSFLF